MRIFKPMTLGVLHKPHRHRGQDHLVIAALGFFRLGGTVSGFLTENVQWPDVLKALPQGEPLDALMPKPRGEYLVAAKAFGPAGTPVREMMVSARVGSLEKTLRVRGDRGWRYSMLPWHVIDPPQPFTEMPLVYQRAYGGEGHPGNPVGAGFTGSRLGAFVGVNHGAMPNIEYPDQHLCDHHVPHPPAGFMPLDIRWQPRAGLLGSYDDDWLANDFPGLARDLDWAAFNTAPEDQRLNGFFRGGEPYCLTGMHPQHAVIQGELPDMRVRALLLRKDCQAQTSEALDLVCDTVWFMPEHALGVAIYRGQVPVADSEAEDVEALLVGYERSADPAKELAHYRQVLALRMDPATCALHALDEAQLTPLQSAQEHRRRQQEQAGAESAFLTAQQRVLDELDADFWAQSGMAKPAEHQPPKAELPPLGLVTKAAAQRGDIDLAGTVARAQALADDAERRRQQAMADLEAQGLSDAAVPRTDPSELIRQAEQRARKPQPDLALEHGEALHEGLLALLKRMEQGDTDFSADERRLLDDGLARLPAMQRQARRLAPTPYTPCPPPEVAQHLRGLVCDWLAAGESLAGRDLSGADLSDLDFKGADLREVLLEHADLHGARLNDARLNGAVLTAASVIGADFSGADLTEANLSQVRAAGAVFRDARLDKVLMMEGGFRRADFSSASLCNLTAQRIDLRDARFDGATLNQAMLHEIKAAGSSWRDAHAALSVFNSAVLNHADLSDARFDSCAMTGLQADGSTWRGARLERVFAGGGSSLRGADLRGMRASHSSWRGAMLCGADLSGAGLLDCDLGTADLSAACLKDAVLGRSLFMHSILRDCDARGAQFYQALLRKADLSGADLRDANLVQANLFEAVFEGADLRGVRPEPLGRAA